MTREELAHWFDVARSGNRVQQEPTPIGLSWADAMLKEFVVTRRQDMERLMDPTNAAERRGE